MPPTARATLAARPTRSGQAGEGGARDSSGKRGGRGAGRGVRAPKRRGGSAGGFAAGCGGGGSGNGAGGERALRGGGGGGARAGARGQGDLFLPVCPPAASRGFGGGVAAVWFGGPRRLRWVWRSPAGPDEGFRCPRGDLTL